MAIMTLICLSIVTLLCAVGALSPLYPDNLFQRVGMGGVGVSCVALGEHVWRLHSITPSCALLSFGLAFYAIGTAAKYVRLPFINVQ